MLKINKLKKTLRRLGYPDQPRAERRTPPSLAVQYGLDSSIASAEIKDISTSGVYLKTEKRLRTDELITLTLHEEASTGTESELRFSVHARVVRQGEDGVGMSFVLPPGLDAQLWEVLVRNIITLEKREQIAQMFYVLRTILFLTRLCQSEAEEAILLLGGQLDEERVQNLVKIALATENALAAEPDFDRRRTDPKLAAKILKQGAWASTDVMIQLWAGLLVSSCTVDVPNSSNQLFVELLIHLQPAQVNLLFFACEQILNPAHKSNASSSIVITARQLTSLTGDADQYRNSNRLAYLFQLGLVQNPPEIATYQPPDSFDITPTLIGLELYRRCHGHRGKVDEDLIESAEKNLLDFTAQQDTSILQ